LNIRLIYVISPYRDKRVWKIGSNIIAALWIALQILLDRNCRACGYFPVVPQANTPFFDDAAPGEYFLAGTMEIMRRCDEAIVGDWWQDSTGCCAEYTEAELRGMKVWHSLADLKRHCANQLFGDDDV